MNLQMVRTRACALLLLSLIAIGSAMFVWSTSLQARALRAYGTVGSGERAHTLIVWDVVVPTTKSIPISQTIRVTDVCILIAVPKGTSRITYPSEQVSAYRGAGFGVYVVMAMNGILFKPSDCSVLLDSPEIKGFGIDGFNLTAFSSNEIEQCLLDLTNAARANAKEFFYYHGDALSPDPMKLSAAGATVWAWWTGAWKPKTWNLTSIWAQTCIWRNRPERPDTTSRDLIGWYESLPRKPEGIVFWQTTNHNDPSIDQIYGMKMVVQKMSNSSSKHLDRTEHALSRRLIAL